MTEKEFTFTVILPQDLIDSLLKCGPVEWGAVTGKSDAQHLADFENTLRLTREHHKTEGDQSLHGLYLKGTEMVHCHTGTSPTSADRARIMHCLWNTLVAAVLDTPTPD